MTRNLRCRCPLAAWTMCKTMCRVKPYMWYYISRSIADVPISPYRPAKGLNLRPASAMGQKGD